MEEVTFSVSEFVALVNQTMEFAYPVVRVEGEVSEMRISKGKWVYFNLVDGNSSVRMFGTVYHLTQPIEDGMKVVVKGTPRLHNKYGFSLNVSSINPSGEGSIKRAFELLKQKLQAEGLFDPARKRALPARPQKIGLITSEQAAAYGDFMKIVNQRWAGLEIQHANVQVQGEPAPRQIVRAIEYFSRAAEPVDVVVITRGGGSSEDLMAFSDEAVARAVAASRIPTIVGVGHEMDDSLADMIADVRATTPTNAAQLVVPDREQVGFALDQQVSRFESEVLHRIAEKREVILRLSHKLDRTLGRMRQKVLSIEQDLAYRVSNQIARSRSKLELAQSRLELLNPKAILDKGYALATNKAGKVIKTGSDVSVGETIVIQLAQVSVSSEVTDVKNN